MRGVIILASAAVLLACALAWGGYPSPYYPNHWVTCCNETGVTGETIDEESSVNPVEIEYLGCPHCLGHVEVCATTPDSTEYDIDIMTSFDLSLSFEEVLPLVQSIAKDTLEALNEAIEEVSSTLAAGVSGFSDKPYQGDDYGFGGSTDYPFFEILNITTDDSLWNDSIDSMVTTGGGGDYNESMLETMAHIALNAEGFGYRTSTNNRRYLILLSDTGYHQAGDWPEAPSGSYVADGILDPEEDYPSVEQVGTALSDANIIPIFLIRPGTPNWDEDYVELINLWGFGYVIPVTEDSTAEEVIEALIPIIVPTAEDYNVTKTISPIDQQFIKAVTPESYLDVAASTEVCFNLSILPSRCWCNDTSVYFNVLFDGSFAGTSNITFTPCEYCLQKYCQGPPPPPPRPPRPPHQPCEMTCRMTCGGGHHGHHGHHGGGYGGGYGGGPYPCPYGDCNGDYDNGVYI